MQLVFFYGFLDLQNISLGLKDWQFILLVLSTVLIAAAGYVINNIFDQETDNYNKPKNVVVGKTISETNAYYIYIALNFTGVAIGFYLSNVICKPGFASLFILITATLYFYASSLKQMLLIGNIIVALLLSFSVLIIGVFNLYPIVNIENQSILANLFSILIDYSVFAFMINFIREIVKDIEDISGDYNQGMNTLPIFIGKQKTTKIVFVLSFIPLFSILYYIKTYLFPLVYVCLYMLVFVVAPLLFFMVKIWTAESQKQFHNLSTLLKWILFFGILSILIISWNRKLL